jgi:CubicO group peptidase (beta-lactamase class C family)
VRYVLTCTLFGLQLFACELVGINHPATAAPILNEIRRLDGAVLTPAQIDERVKRLMQGGNVPGVGLAILNDGQIVYLRGYGKRDVDRRLQMTEMTPMYAASFTKSMFAFLAMQLVDQKSLELDKPIQNYLKRPLHEFPAYAELRTDERYQQITPRMCLSHTTGLPNWRFIDREGEEINGDAPLSIWLPPGRHYSYSGEGMRLLQFAVEEGLGHDIKELMENRVFHRLGMSNTAMTWQDRFKMNAAIGYDERGKAIEIHKPDEANVAGSATTTIEDMARFVQGLLNGDELEDVSRQEMLRPQVRIRTQYQFPVGSVDEVPDNDHVKLSYGLGFGLLSTPYGRAFFKEGHDDGWEHYMIAFDKPKSAVIIMTNSSNGESIFRHLLAELMADTFTPWRWERYTSFDDQTAK